MPSAESVSVEHLILCACGEREYNTRDVIDAALWRGDLGPLWTRFLTRLEAEKQADEAELEIEDEAIESAAEAFRYQRDLITAEETEQWLATRGLTLEDFSDYFTREYWGTRLGDEIDVPETSYRDASDEMRQLFAADLILSGDIDWLTTQLIWRLAARCAESELDSNGTSEEEEEFYDRHGIEAAALPEWLTAVGRDLVWFKEMLSMEIAYQRRRQSVLLPNAYKQEVTLLRLPLTRFEAEVIELESRDAASEALFCVTEDGMSMEEVAAEGRYPFRRVSFLLEDLPAEIQQTFLSVSAGELVDPMPRGDGFELCRVIKKIEPDPHDPAIKQRVEQRLLDRHFGELSSKHVERRLGAVVQTE